MTWYRTILFLVILCLVFLTTRAFAHGPISSFSESFTEDETYCLCSQERMPATGNIDPCSSGVPWKALVVDPPTILRVVRQAQALHAMREKLAVTPMPELPLTLPPVTMSHAEP